MSTLPPTAGQYRLQGSHRNLALIPIHQGLTHALVWLPVMVLFTRSRFGLGQALTLSALYYLSVVILEVPSGWMSDRLGRVVTLRVAGAAWIVAQTCLLIGDDSFVLVLFGQFFLAAGFASLSGTDVTFHYDTLETLGRAAEYPARQARVASIGFTVTAVSALVGGVVGFVALRAVFAVALALAIVQLLVAFRLTEPAASGSEPEADPGRQPAVEQPATAVATVGGLGDQLTRCARYLRQPFLAWLFAYGVVLVTLEHVAFSVLQPWLTELNDGSATDIGATPMLSGLVFAVVALVGAGAARASDPLARRFGVVSALLGLAVLSAIIVTTMAIWVAPAVLILVAFRSAQGAAAPVLISGAVASRVERHHRATLLSLNSLAGRLVWGLILLSVGRIVGDDVGRSLGLLSWVAWSMVAVAVGWAALLVRQQRDQASLREAAEPI